MCNIKLIPRCIAHNSLSSQISIFNKYSHDRFITHCFDLCGFKNWLQDYIETTYEERNTSTVVEKNYDAKESSFLFCELWTVKCLYPKIYKKTEYLDMLTLVLIRQVISKKTSIFEYNLPSFIHQIDSEAEWDMLGYLNVLFI